MNVYSPISFQDFRLILIHCSAQNEIKVALKLIEKADVGVRVKIYSINVYRINQILVKWTFFIFSQVLLFAFLGGRSLSQIGDLGLFHVRILACKN